MNIDNLISKYLDGELSEKEDLKLRNLISTNEKARYVFNNYIDLHLTTKEDADSINTPFNLFSDTEDKVLMAIMNAKPIADSTTSSFSIFHIFPKQLATMVAVLLIVCFANISDLGFLNEIVPNYSKSTMEMNIPNSKIYSVNFEKGFAVNTIKKENKNLTPNTDSDEISPSLTLANAKSENLETNEAQASTINAQLSKDIATVKQNANNPKVEDNSTIDINSQKSSTPTINIIGANTSSSTTLFDDINNRIRPSQNTLSINNIQLSAFSSRPYTVFGFDKGANASLQSYSQAISLSINESTNIGLEIGFSDINYKGEIFTSTKVLDKYGRETGQQLVFRTEQDKEYALYWGQFFFQTELYNVNNFDLGLRLGLGMSSDGLNSNSKLLASYEITNGLKLITGTEFSYFSVSLPQLVNAGSGNYYSFSFIYGLQFSF